MCAKVVVTNYEPEMDVYRKARGGKKSRKGKRARK